MSAKATQTKQTEDFQKIFSYGNIFFQITQRCAASMGENATHRSNVDPQSWIQPLRSSLGRLK